MMTLINIVIILSIGTMAIRIITTAVRFAWFSTIIIALAAPTI